MPQATGLFKQVAFKRELTFGTAPSASGAQLLRRVQSTIDLSKDTYQSQEIRPDMQIADFRHGVRRVKGQVMGEMSPGTYSDFFAVALKRDFTAGVSSTGLSYWSTAGSGASSLVLNRTTGSFLTDGYKVGDVVRITAGAVAAGNLNKNLYVTAVTASTMTVTSLNGSALTVEGSSGVPITGVTIAAQGKKTYIPTTGQTDNSYSIEHWYGDINQSEVFTGCKMDKLTVDLGPTGMAKLSADVLGQGITTAALRYFTSPTAITTTGIVASVNGLLFVNGAQIATVTGLQLVIDPTFSDAAVVGSNVVPALFPGEVRVSGQFTTYFTDNTLRDLFVNETESSLMVCLTSDNTAASNFVAFTLPRIKVGGQQKNDGSGGIVQTFPFTALLNVNGGAGVSSEQTTISVQDSAA